MQDNQHNNDNSKEWPSTFEQWFRANLGDYASDIANHGADAGYPHITYTSDTVEIFDQYDAEIWDMAIAMADGMGAKNVAEFISGFRRDDMLAGIHTFKNLMVWFACEELARKIENGPPTFVCAECEESFEDEDDLTEGLCYWCERDKEEKEEKEAASKPQEEVIAQ